MNLGLSRLQDPPPQHLAGCSLSVSCPDPQGPLNAAQLKTLPSQCISNFLFSSRTLFLQVKTDHQQGQLWKSKRELVCGDQGALRERNTDLVPASLSWRNLLNKVRNQQDPQRSWLELERMLISAKVESWRFWGNRIWEALWEQLHPTV